MPLQNYVTTHLSAGAWAQLQPWYNALSASPNLELIQRNIDRECDRNDINALPWQDFLNDVIAKHAGLDACKTIDNVLGSNRSHYALPGKALPALDDTRRLYRFMRLDQLANFNLKSSPIALTSNYESLANNINSGKVSGANLDGTQLGQSGYPSWCTLSGNPAWRASADRARDRIGLKHIDDGFLVELDYPAGMLRNVGAPLQAPTVLDSWAKGASNWIFAKRRGSGGPDWGNTVDLDGGGACGKGSTEAVHASFVVPAGQGYMIGLTAHGPIENSAPSVNFRKLLLNPAV
jgi:hypothetical protein